MQTWKSPRFALDRAGRSFERDEGGRFKGESGGGGGWIEEREAKASMPAKPPKPPRKKYPGAEETHKDYYGPSVRDVHKKPAKDTASDEGWFRKATPR